MSLFLRRLLLLACLTVAALYSCQDERQQQSQSESLLDRNSALTPKLSQLTANDTSVDNVMDSTNCFRVELPVQVIVSGQLVTVATPEDYALVAQLLQTPAGGTVDFVYPITVITSAYAQLVIHDDGEYAAAVADCDTVASINCVDLIYPITVSVYETTTQNPRTVNLASDEEFFLFLAALQSGEGYEIVYPVTGVAASGIPFSIGSNAELDEAINTAIADCDCANPQILIDDLIFYMPIANEIQDLTGISAPSLNGEAEFVEDRDGNPNGAIHFLGGGTNDFIALPGNAANDLLQQDAFTISLWFNRQNPNTGELEEMFVSNELQVLLGNTNFLPDHGPLVFAQGTTVADNDWTSQQIGASLGVWHHLAITYDGSLLRLYRDGLLRNSANVTFSGALSGGNFGMLFVGYLDDVRFYRRSLSAAEISTLFNLEADVNTCLD